MFESLIQKLKADKKRITKVRKEIIRYICNTKKPVNAEEIFDHLHNQKINTHKTTVYREINFLLKYKILNSVYLSTEKNYYESSYLPVHHHFICEKCGVVKEIDCCYIDSIKAKIEKQGYMIKRHNFEVFGLCNLCTH